MLWLGRIQLMIFVGRRNHFKEVIFSEGFLEFKRVRGRS